MIRTVERCRAFIIHYRPPGDKLTILPLNASIKTVFRIPSAEVVELADTPS